MTHVPDAAFDKHVALLGMTGAGKTSVIKTAIVEPDLEADRRVLIITPKDDWWGLRLSKSGKGDGFNIPIFGGRHEDYPLQVKDAALLAETYGTMKGSAIFCTSRLSVQDRARWFAAFAEKLLSANRGWVRVVIDEAHVFMPKQGGKGGGAIPSALHAGNELVSQGRSGGLRIVLASQRSAKLHNDALTQCSCLIAMLLMAPHDRDAVKDWIEDQADPQRGKEIIASLATLNPGQAWVWAPGAKFLERVQFARPSTFDSSAAPDDGSDAEHRLKPINLDALKGKLAKVEAEAKAKDPKQIPTLQAEVARLTKALASAGETKPSAAPDKATLEAAEARGFERGKKELATAADRRIKDAQITLISGLIDLVDPLAQFLANELKSAKADKTKIAAQVTFTPSPVTRAPAPRPTAPVRVAAPRAPSAANGSSDLAGPEQRILNSISTWHDMGHQRPTNAQVAWLAGYAPAGGAYKNPRGALKTRGLIDYPEDDRLALTDDGRAHASAIELDGSLADFVLSRVKGPEQRILRGVIAAYPESLSNAETAAAAGYAPDGGAYKNPRGALRTKSLIEYPQADRIRAAEWLFAS